MKKKLYCENCLEDIKLKYYIEDSLGSIFCSEECLENSLDYRELKKIPQFFKVVRKIIPYFKKELKGGLKE